MGVQLSLSAGVTGAPTPTVRWQISSDGSSWSDIPSATSNPARVAFGMADNGKYIRIVATNAIGSVESNPALLTISVNYSLNGQPGIDAFDALTFLSLFESTSAEDVIRADFNGDGVINDADLAMILGQLQ
jgi:hypothetical protein